MKTTTANLLPLFERILGNCLTKFGSRELEFAFDARDGRSYSFPVLPTLCDPRSKREALAKPARAEVCPMRLAFVAPMRTIPNAGNSHKRKTRESRVRHSLALAIGMFLASASAIKSEAQVIPLKVARENSQLSISWTNGLGLVQPQKSADVAVAAWQDFGASTTLTNFLDVISTNRAFYRLRFLAPNIIAQPQDQGVGSGGNATFAVGATGTAPITYQWRKNSTNLIGQTAASLSLSNVAANDFGNYSVVLANTVGAVTSIVAVLNISATSAPARGIYMGNFSAQTNGGFAMMINSNAQAVILGQSVGTLEGLLVTNITVAADGSFSAVSDKGGKLNGKATDALITGSLVSTNATTNTFSAPPKSSIGVHATDTGFYVGTFGGAILTGNAYFILAADGTAFVFVSSSILGAGGNFGMIDAKNTLTATTSYVIPGTTVPAQILITGTLNTTTHEFAGGFSFSGITLGTFSLKRFSSP